MFGLPKELSILISIDNPTTYYNLLQTAKIFKLDEEIMKAKFIKITKINNQIERRLPNNWLHSCNDQPAVICENGTQYWYINGKLYRDNDQPVAIMADGSQYWYVNDKRHRDNDRPAVIQSNGDQYWYINGELHRDNDQPVMVYTNGGQGWYIDGKVYIQYPP